MNTDLRPRQQSALNELRRLVGMGERRIVVQGPTGFGKTKLAAAIVDGARSKDKRVLFTVPRISLVEQTVQSFYAEGIRGIGVIQGHHEMTDWEQPVQVASVQTLARRKIPEADIVICDEIHLLFELYSKWFTLPEWQKIPIIGLSATPWTRGLGKLFSKLIIAGTTQELIDEGLLSPFRVFAPAHPDLKKVRTVAGDYHEGDLSDVMSDSVLVADAVDTWMRLGENRSTLCFAVDRAHAKHLQNRFLEAGVTCAYIDAFTKIEEREEIKQKFHNGEYRVVTSVGTMIVGVDWDVRCIVFCRPTKSEMLFVQGIGRGLRTAEGKENLIVLDHSSNHRRLGFVTDIHHEKLDDGKAKAKPKEKSVRLPKECPQCSYLRPPNLRKCPNCGFVPVVQVGENQDGELQELTSAKKSKPKKKEWTYEEKSDFYAQLKFIGRERGYAEGWAANQYRTKFSVWPNGFKNCDPKEASPEVRSWVKSRQIAYAKSKEKNARVNG